LKEQFDTVLPRCDLVFPVQRSLKDGRESQFSYPEYAFARSQDLMPSFHDVQFYWMNTKKCMVLQEILTDNTGSVEISELEGQDIDNEVDWKPAELKYEPLQSIK
jgi:N-acylneuraminate cytidylyltransferase